MDVGLIKAAVAAGWGLWKGQQVVNLQVNLLELGESLCLKQLHAARMLFIRRACEHHVALKGRSYALRSLVCPVVWFEAS